MVYHSIDDIVSRSNGRHQLSNKRKTYDIRARQLTNRSLEISDNTSG